jgi:hypothetical protein
MKQLKKLWLLLALPLLLGGCEKEEEFPPATQEGKNTMAFKLNGREWIASSVRADETAGTFIALYGGRKDDYPTICIAIRKKDFFTVEEKVYDFGDTSQGISFVDKKGLVCVYGYTDVYTNEKNMITGTVKITRYDFEKAIISGEFELVLKGRDCQDSVVITEGRFDIGSPYFYR